MNNLFEMIYGTNVTTKSSVINECKTSISEV